MRGWIWAAILMAGQAAAEPGCPSGTEALEPCGQGDCPSRFPPAPVSRVLEVNRGEFHAPVGSPIELGCQLYQP